MPSHGQKDLAPNDIAEFLKPLFPHGDYDYTSLTHFRHNHEEIISKINATGRPVVLIVNRQRLLLCSLSTYLDLETRRERLTAKFKSVEDAIQLGKIDFSSPSLLELDEAQREVSELEDSIKNSKWALKRLKEKLPKAKERLSKLIAGSPLPTIQ
jgi:septation ring formation regulator EzrA